MSPVKTQSTFLAVFFRITEEHSRWGRHKVNALLAALTELNIERQLDIAGVRKGVLFGRVEQLLKELQINRA